MCSYIPTTRCLLQFLLLLQGIQHPIYSKYRVHCLLTFASESRLSAYSRYLDLIRAKFINFQTDSPTSCA
ncbi:hypothetical protein Mapa_004603 [Marchantia paleacea]|nr:hypothetical protein Mapa_004603 [Marchantia paleacea]